MNYENFLKDLSEEEIRGLTGYLLTHHNTSVVKGILDVEYNSHPHLVEELYDKYMESEDMTLLNTMFDELILSNEQSEH